MATLALRCATNAQRTVGREPDRERGLAISGSCAVARPSSGMGATPFVVPRGPPERLAGILFKVDLAGAALFLVAISGLVVGAAFPLNLTW